MTNLYFALVLNVATKFIYNKIMLGLLYFLYNLILGIFESCIVKFCHQIMCNISSEMTFSKIIILLLNGVRDAMNSII